MILKKYRILFTLILGLVAIVSILLFARTWRTAHHSSASANSVYQAITSEKQWLNTSRALSSKDLSGRIVLLDFWTYCCINCMHVIPDLHRLEDEFGGNLTVIGVHSAKFDNEKDAANIREAVLRYEINHPVINDSNFRIWNAFGVNAWPTFILIDPSGKIYSQYSGEGNYENLRRDILAIQKLYPTLRKLPDLPLRLESEKEPPQDLSYPGKLAIDDDEKILFISDSNHHRLLGVRLDPLGEVLMEIGRKGEKGRQDGSFEQARFNRPQGLAYQDGVLYVADTENHLIRKVDLKRKVVTTIAGTGMQGFDRAPKEAPALQTALSSPWDVEFFPDADHLAIAMAGTHQIWSLDLKRQTLSTLAGNGRESIDDGLYPHNSLSQPSGLAAYSGKLYFVDSETSSLRIFENGRVRTLIGTGLFDFGFQDGVAAQAKLQHPLGVYADESGVYIADAYNHSIRRYDFQTGVLQTIVGDGKRGKLNEPNDVLKFREAFIVADTNHHQVKLIAKSGEEKRLKLHFSPAISNSTTDSEKPIFPNLVTLPPVQLRGGVLVRLHLSLPEEMKINEQAPSFVEILKINGDRESVVQKITSQSIQSKIIEVGPLTEGDFYRLQGTLYICRTGQEAFCELWSFKQDLMVSSSGNKEWTLDVQSHDPSRK